MNSITPEELKARLDTGDKPFLLDVREAWEYALCSIEGSTNIVMSDIERMQNEIKPDQETIVICHHGMRSFQIANYLESIGYNYMTNLEGGVAAWAQTVDAEMAQY